MGRTATAFLVLIAVGGCVADNQRPAAAVLAAQHGQPIHASAPSYATWTHSDQFAVLQDASPNPAPQPMPPPPPAPAPMPMTTTTALKPTAVRKPILVPGDKTLKGASQDGLPSEPMVDPDLVQATMVSTPGNSDLGAKDGPAKNTVAKATAAKGAPAGSVGAWSETTPQRKVSTADGEPPTTAAATRMVNCKRITLNYELKDIGSTGVAGVELWTTQDTRSWKKGKIVAKTNHSFTVEVKDEGLYGFTLLARNGSGAGTEAPQPGDQPQVWVSVDVTKPVVQITRLELIHGGKTPTLMIRWTAKDKNLGPRPINLAFAAEAEGPWTPIAAGLDNNGQYEWQPTGGLPHHLYVRVEASDLNGNVGAAQTSNPLRIDGASTSVARPPSESTATARKLLPPPPPLDASRPSAAIMAVEPNSN